MNDSTRTLADTFPFLFMLFFAGVLVGYIATAVIITIPLTAYLRSTTEPLLLAYKFLTWLVPSSLALFFFINIPRHHAATVVFLIGTQLGWLLMLPWVWAIAPYPNRF